MDFYKSDSRFYMIFYIHILTVLTKLIISRTRKKVKIFSSISGAKAQTIDISKISWERQMSKNQKSTKNEKKESVLADIPLGLSSALARNVSAMRVFAEMPDDKRQSFIEGARAVSSKEEMKAYVNSIGSAEN